MIVPAPMPMASARAAPDAVQVADRWHLLRNLGEAIQALGNWHVAAARRAAQHGRCHLAAAPAPAVANMKPALPIPTATQLESAASREHRQARYQEAARLYDIGASITRISAELGADRKTVRGWLLPGHAPLCQQPSGDSILELSVPDASWFSRTLRAVGLVRGGWIPQRHRSTSLAVPRVSNPAVLYPKLA